jgi:prepilin-type N-terminal cleavage/methylation domain-containing protein
MLQKLRGNNQKGFTLIELMIVIAIIGILAAIAIPNFIAYRDKAFCGYTETDAQNILAALASYFSEPDHTQTPDIQDLEDTEDLTLNNNQANMALVSGSSTGTITVTVTDQSGRCPRSTLFSVTMGGSSGAWQ